MNIRKATSSDLNAIVQIYDDIHTAEEAGVLTVGWARGVYPVRATAADAIARGDMYVMEAGEFLPESKKTVPRGVLLSSLPESGEGICGAAIINQTQVSSYAGAPWEHEAETACVLHTLVISPKASGRGYGRAFVAFYEELAAQAGIRELRLDTNARNAAARSMYRKMGYREIAVVPTVFNGIPGVDLVLLEKNTGQV